MALLNFAKGALAAFWLLAALNLFYPLGDAWYWPVNLIAGATLLAHVGEVALFNKRLSQRPQPWLDCVQVLLFGILHVRGLRQA